MTRHTRLHRRGSVYYLRAKVPVELQKAMGKNEIKWSLKMNPARIPLYCGTRFAKPPLNTSGAPVTDWRETVAFQCKETLSRQVGIRSHRPADKENNLARLAPNSLRNYFFNMFSIFGYAVQTKLISENPFDDYWFKQQFSTNAQGGEEEDDVTEFTVEELNKVFRAPLYTGCQNDERGCAKPGLNISRRGRLLKG